MTQELKIMGSLIGTVDSMNHVGSKLFIFGFRPLDFLTNVFKKECFNEALIDYETGELVWNEIKVRIDSDEEYFYPDEEYEERAICLLPILNWGYFQGYPTPYKKG